MNNNSMTTLDLKPAILLLNAHYSLAIIEILIK